MVVTSFVQQQCSGNFFIQFVSLTYVKTEIDYGSNLQQKKQTVDLNFFFEIWGKT